MRSFAAIFVFAAALFAPGFFEHPVVHGASVGSGDTLSPHLASEGIGVVWIFSAFLGGLCLNLMPCIFPILIVRSLAVAHLALRQPGIARLQSLTFTAGAVLTMLLIGVLLLLIKAGGNYVGWSPRSPVFITLMTWFTFAIGLNFAGVLEISPRYDRFRYFLTGRFRMRGSFVDGLLSATISTSCSAPFIGGAVAAALMAPPLEALGVFLALGLGLALPFAAICFLPGLQGLLPKPGPWMVTLQQALSFPMFATSIWLLWIMTKATGAEGTVIVAVGGLLLSFFAWTSRFHGRLARFVLAMTGVGLVLLLAAVAAPERKHADNRSVGYCQIASVFCGP